MIRLKHYEYKNSLHLFSLEFKNKVDFKRFFSRSSGHIAGSAPTLPVFLQGDQLYIDKSLWHNRHLLPFEPEMQVVVF
jgi:hypothetical protein